MAVQNLEQPSNLPFRQENHCYENAIAGPFKGILKDKFYLEETLTNIEQAKRAAKNAIKLYNEVRVHLSLDYKIPNMVSNKKRSIVLAII